MLCPAWAGTYTVTSTADTADVGTLRWAITQANADPGSTIAFQDNLGTIAFASPPPLVTVAMTINPGTGNTISGTNGFATSGGANLLLSGNSSFGGTLSPNGGTFTVTGNVITGSTTGIATQGGTATLEITGSSANWTSHSDILIGLDGGVGYLVISDGASASDTFALIGRNTSADTGHVTVTGGSTWTHSAGLVIGTGGTGTMLVNGGSQVSNADGMIGGNAGSSGAVTVTGADSLWTSTDYLVVGGAGVGALTIADSGNVKVGATGAGTLTLGNSGAGSGALNIGAAAGGPAAAPGTVEAAIVTGGSGSGTKLVNFNHTANDYVFAANLTGSLAVQHNGTGRTLLSGTNSYTGGTAINAGTLALGTTGTLASTGNVTMTGGTFDLGASRTHTLVTLSLIGGHVVGNGTALTVSNFSGSGQVTGLNSLTTTQSGDTTFSGVLQSTRLILDGSGTLTLDGSGNNFHATATVDAGTLVLAKAGTPGVTHAIGDGLIINSGGTVKIAGATGDQIYWESPVAVNAGGTFDLNGRNESLGSLTGGGTVTNSATGTASLLTLGENIGSAFTFSGALQDGAGTLALAKIGDGTLTLSGANTYTGSTAVNAGTLQFANRDALASAANLSVASGATASFNVGGANEFTSVDLGAISSQGTFQAGSFLGLDTTHASGAFAFDAALLGSVDLAKRGSGTLALSGMNSFSGKVQIDAGTVDVGASTVDVARFSGSGTLTGSGAFTYDSNSNHSLGASLAGSGSLTKTGDGTLILSGANSYSGSTTVSAGTLQFDHRSALYNGDTASWTVANLTVAAGATAFFKIGGADAFTSGDITLLNSLGTASGGFLNGSFIGLEVTSFIEFDGTLSNPNSGANALGLVVKGEGWLILKNATTYTGGTTINDAVIYLDENGALPTGGDVTLNNGIFDLGLNHDQTVGALTINGGGLYGNHTTTVTASSFSGSDGIVTTRWLTSTQTGDTTFSGALWNTLLILSGSGTLSLSGPGSGNHIGMSATVNAGTLVLGKTDTPTIDTALTINSGGTVRLAATDDQISSNAPVVVNTGGTLDLNGRNESLGTLTGGGTITNSVASTTSTLTLGENIDSAFTFSGTMQNGAGTLALAKIGAGTLTLTGSNTFTGGTTITAGTLQMGHASALGTGGIQIDAAGTLDASASRLELARVTGSGTLTGSGTFAYDSNSDHSLGATLAGSASLSKTGSGTLLLSRANTYTGPTTVNAGTLQFASPSALYNGDTASWTAANLTVAAGATATFKVGGDGEFTADDIALLSSLGTASSGFLDGSSIGFELSDSFFIYSAGLANPNSGTNALGLVVQGSNSTLLLGGNNTYTGGTTINGSNLLWLSPTGTLPVAGAVTLNDASLLLGTYRTHTIGALAVNGGNSRLYGSASTLTVSSFSGSAGIVDLDSGSLISTQTGDTTFSGALTNTHLILDGSGSLSLSGPGSGNHIGVSATVNAGTLVLGKTDTPSIDTALTINSGGTVRLAATDDQISSNAPVVVNTGGTLDLNGRNENLGTLTGGGTITNSVASTTSTLTLGENTDSAFTFSGTMQNGAGTLALAKIGDGTLTLSGSNTFTGGTTITAGTLSIGDGGASGSLVGDITNNATLVFNRSTASSYPGAISGSGTLTKLGDGTLTFSGASNYTGATSIDAGSLIVNGALGHTTVTVAADATLGGSGTIGGPTTLLAGAHLAPGNSAGTLTLLNGLTLEHGSFLDFELGSISDRILLAGGGLFTVPTDGTITLNLSDAGGFSAGTYTLFDFVTGTLHEDFSLGAFAFGDVIPGYDFHFSLDIGNRRLDLIATTSAIPEPSTYAALAGLATLGFAAWRRRSKRNADPHLGLLSK